MIPPVLTTENSNPDWLAMTVDQLSDHFATFPINQPTLYQIQQIRHDLEQQTIIDGVCRQEKIAYITRVEKYLVEYMKPADPPEPSVTERLRARVQERRHSFQRNY